MRFTPRHVESKALVTKDSDIQNSAYRFLSRSSLWLKSRELYALAYRLLQSKPDLQTRVIKSTTLSTLTAQVGEITNKVL